jgi:NADPH:quinone reductase-like Zn-dependent oxidoreductase
MKPTSHLDKQATETPMMKAVINARYGSPDVLEIRQVPKPEPKAGEVLIRVHATTVSRTDCGMLRPHPFFVRFVAGLRRPKRTVLGMDFAGEVEAVGAGVTAFKPGDRVFGVSPDDYGAHAEYLCVPEKGAMATMPAGAGFGAAVVCEGAWYADTYLQAFRLKTGHSILVYGASGAIGTAAVQLAKSYGARVTAVVATRHLDLVRTLAPTAQSTTRRRTSRKSVRPSILCSTRWAKRRFSVVGDC